LAAKSRQDKIFLQPRGISLCLRVPHGKQRLICPVDCDEAFTNWAGEATIAGNFRHIRRVF